LCPSLSRLFSLHLLDLPPMGRPPGGSLVSIFSGRHALELDRGPQRLSQHPSPSLSLWHLCFLASRIKNSKVLALRLVGGLLRSRSLYLSSLQGSPPSDGGLGPLGNLKKRTQTHSP